MTTRLTAALSITLVLGAVSPAADPYLVGPDPRASSPREANYPVTELRRVQRPDQFHYVLTTDGQYVLTDWWWEEVSVDSRQFQGGNVVADDAHLEREFANVWLDLSPGQWPADATGVPDRGGAGVGPGSIGYDDGRLTRFTRAVYVELVDGDGRVGEDKSRIRPATFFIFAGERRKVRVELKDDSFLELVASYDGYGVDLGAARVARTEPNYNGVRQELGNSPEIEDLEVIVYWDSDQGTNDPGAREDAAGHRRELESTDPLERSEGRVIQRRTYKYRSN